MAGQTGRYFSVRISVTAREKRPGSPLSPARPVGKKISAVMAGAQIRHLYPLCRNPRLLQDDLIGPPQIQPVLAAALIVKDLRRLSRLPEFVPESLCHIFTDLVTGAADGRADGCRQILRPCTVYLFHLLRNASAHPRHGPPPAGMRQRDRAVSRIHEIQRHTVRIESRQHDPRLIGQQTVYIMVVSGPHDSFAAVLSGDHPQIHGMRLVGADDILQTAAQHPSDPPEILVHGLLLVPSGVAQIHAAAHPLADSSEPGRKQMPHDPCLLQQRKRQILHFPGPVLLHFHPACMSVQFHSPVSPPSQTPVRGICHD